MWKSPDRVAGVTQQSLVGVQGTQVVFREPDGCRRSAPAHLRCGCRGRWWCPLSFHTRELRHQPLLKPHRVAQLRGRPLAGGFEPVPLHCAPPAWIHTLCCPEMATAHLTAQHPRSGASAGPQVTRSPACWAVPAPAGCLSLGTAAELLGKVLSSVEDSM